MTSIPALRPAPFSLSKVCCRRDARVAFFGIGTAHVLDAGVDNGNSEHDIAHRKSFSECNVQLRKPLE